MLSRLILLFVGVPLVELAILLQVAQWIGLLPTVALVVATGIAGAALARHQGLRAFLAVQEELAVGRLPGRSLLDGLSILVGGAFLLTPGILTDVAGFSLLVPLTRRWLQRAVRRRLERRIREGTVEFRVFTPRGGAGGRGYGGGADVGRGDLGGRGTSESGGVGRGGVGRGDVGTHPPRYRDSR